MTRHVPARTDGRWLADRRDGAPSQGRLISDQGSGNYARPEKWIFELTRLDLESALKEDDGKVTVWGWWEDRTYSRSQTVSVRSALVTSNTALSLLTALQTAPSPDDFRIPDARDNEYSYDERDFTIAGWVDEVDYHPEAADTRDPHAGSVSFPPPQPTEEIQSLLGLTTDPARRIWSRGHDTVMLLSRVWSDKDGDGRGTSGHRLATTPAALQELLVRTGRSLLLEVLVRRNIDHQYRTRHEDDERFTYFTPSAKYYLVDQYGHWFEYP